MAFDARGHGRSSKPAPPYPWRNFGADVAAIAESIGTLGRYRCRAFHGRPRGHAGSASIHPAAFSALVLLDPVIRAPDQYPDPGPNRIRSQAAQRVGVGPRDVRALRESRALRLLGPASAARLLRTWLGSRGRGLRAGVSSRHRSLRLRKQHRAGIEHHAEIATIGFRFMWFARPLSRPCRGHENVAHRAGSGVDISQHGKDTCLAECSHFIPMEAPDLAAKLIRRTLSPCSNKGMTACPSTNKLTYLKKGLADLIREEDLRERLSPSREDRPAAAREGGVRSHGARSAPGPHRAAAQDEALSGSGASA